MLLSRPWGACLAPEPLQEARSPREALYLALGKGLLPGVRSLQVRDAGMRRFPGFSSVPWSLSGPIDLWLVTATVRFLHPHLDPHPRNHSDPAATEGAAPLREGVVSCGVAAPPGWPRRTPDHLSPAAPRPFPEGWGRRAERTVEALPCTAAARRMRTTGQVRGALTSWHSPSPLAVTLYIRVSCPPHSEPPSPPSPGSSRLRQRGRCGGAPGPAAAARSGPGAPPSAVRSRRRLREARPSA